MDQTKDTDRDEHFEAMRKYVDSTAQSKDDYIICKMRFTDKITQEKAFLPTIPFDGLCFILVTKGSLTLEINTEEFEIKPNVLFTIPPNSYVKVNRAGGTEEVELYALKISIQFLKSINLDLFVLQSAYLSRVKTPMLQLDESNAALVLGYFNILHTNASENTDENIFTLNISRSLISAMIYQLLLIAETLGIANEDDETDGDESDEQKIGLRRFSYVKRFIELVHQYYTKERSVGFYSDKLCISPKYLSYIIKKATSRSAAEWIDEYVVLEAKNMLRFSGMNVQQVAYALNFNNQSSFGKYFKHLTGMSPSQFKKS